jgi:hypothetical protein
VTRRSYLLDLDDKGRRHVKPDDNTAGKGPTLTHSQSINR